MDTNDSQMLGLSIVDDPSNHHISFEEGSLGGKRSHLDSASSTDNDNSLSDLSPKAKRIKMENNSNSVDSVEFNSEELLRRNTCDDLGEGNILGVSPTDAISSVAEDTDEDGCVLIHHMDIKEPLINLKKALEEAHSICLDGYDFYLQDTTLLAGHKNLVEQCVQGCGTVQINLQLKIEDDGTRKINIIDVLKPSDSYLLATGHPAFSPDTLVDPDKFDTFDKAEISDKSEPPPPEDPPEKNLIRWVVDQNFRANQQRLQIPQDPMEWDVTHVRHWLLWAVRQFNLTGIKLSDWRIPGTILCSLTLDDFRVKVPHDPADIFWTHLELLRRCNFVAVMQNPDQVFPSKTDEQKKKEMELHKNIMRNREKRKLSLSEGKKPVVLMEQNAVSTFTSTAWGSRSGNNGQVQLWQFLLDLLTDKNHRNSIQWLGAEGEFKLLMPERVAQLWGLRKNKPSMNYEKLSRALRYYYDGDMISKVHGKRFVYKFVCDLKQLLGYSAYELNRLVIEAEMRTTSANDPLEHTIFGKR